MSLRAGDRVLVKGEYDGIIINIGPGAVYIHYYNGRLPAGILSGWIDEFSVQIHPEEEMARLYSRMQEIFYEK